MFEFSRLRLPKYDDKLLSLNATILFLVTQPLATSVKPEIGSSKQYTRTKILFSTSLVVIEPSCTMEWRHLPNFWMFCLLMNGISIGQEYVDNGPDIENEIVHQPAVIEVTKCPESVNTFRLNANLCRKKYESTFSE